MISEKFLPGFQSRQNAQNMPFSVVAMKEWNPRDIIRRNWIGAMWKWAGTEVHGGRVVFNPEHRVRKCERGIRSVIDYASYQVFSTLLLKPCQRQEIVPELSQMISSYSLIDYSLADLARLRPGHDRIARAFLKVQKVGFLKSPIAGMPHFACLGSFSSVPSDRKLLPNA